jgi:hypothetical protein
LGDPVVFDRAECLARLALSLCPVEDRHEVLELSVARAENEGVVAVVDVCRDERRSFRIGTCDDEVLDTHNVVLESDGDETVDVLRDGHKDLALQKRSA